MDLKKHSSVDEGRCKRFALLFPEGPKQCQRVCAHFMSAYNKAWDKVCNDLVVDSRGIASEDIAWASAANFTSSVHFSFQSPLCSKGLGFFQGKQQKNNKCYN
eukprot:5446224-Amphidinium_carterae.1